MNSPGGRHPDRAVTRSRPSAMLVSLFCLLLIATAPASFSQTLQDAGLWDVVDQSFTFPDHGLNPEQAFDLDVRATFVHADETIDQALFYNGGDEWVLRFQASRRGEWQWSTPPGDTPLHGLSGTITVGDPVGEARGGVVAVGNKFARQIDETTLEPMVFAPYMNDLREVGFPPYGESPARSHDHLRNLTPEMIEAYLDQAQAYGFDTIFARVFNYWFSWGALFHDEHSSTVPDLQTFEYLEDMLARANRRGMTVHIWKWGKENADQDWRGSVIGVGGINGIPDRRLQRYIAARLGPIPNWSMNYSFDLEEWTEEDQIEEWARYMNDHLGWPHLLGARGRPAPSLSYNSISNWLGDTAAFPPPRTYADVLRDIDPDRPSVYEERFLFMRQHSGWPRFTQETTRRHMWWYAMAGGSIAGFWGPAAWTNAPGLYPNPEQFLTHRDFWEDRLLVDMAPDDTIAGGTEESGVALSNGRVAVVYAQDVNRIALDLTGWSGDLLAVAVDTIGDYQEIDLGGLLAGIQDVTLPYVSDWAIAIGYPPIGHLDGFARFVPPGLPGVNPPDVVEETPPDVVEETPPDVVEETPPDVVEETPPEDVVEETPPPDVVEETPPDVVEETPPDVVEETPPDEVIEETPTDVVEEQPVVQPRPSNRCSFMKCISPEETPSDPVEEAPSDTVEETPPDADSDSGGSDRGSDRFRDRGWTSSSDSGWSSGSRR